MSKKIGYFDVLKSVISKDNVSDENIIKHFKPFLVTKWLSASPQVVYEMNKLNRYKSNLDVLAEYRFLKHSIKLPKSTFIPFDKKDEYMHVVIECIQKEYMVSKSVSKEYIYLMGGERVHQIMSRRCYFNEISIKDPYTLELRKITTKYKDDIKNLKGIK